MPGSSPLSFRILGYILLFSMLFTLIATGVQLYSDYRRAVGLVHERLEQIEAGYTSSLSSSLWALDQNLLQVQLEGILNLPDIIRVHLSILPDSEIHLGQTDSGNQITHKFPIYHQADPTRLLGELTVVASLDRIHSQAREKILAILATQGFETFLLSAFILWMIQKLVTRHLIRMAGYARLLHLDGLHVPLELDRPTSPVKDELQQVTDAINDMRIRLIDELRQHREDARRIRQLSEALEQCPIGVLICDTRWRIIYGNAQFMRMAGCQLEQILGHHPSLLLPALPPSTTWDHIETLLKQDQSWQGEFRRHGDMPDEDHWEQLNITPVKDEQGAIVNYLLMNKDISERKRYEQQLLRQANYDLLTGLPNRVLAHDRLKLALAQSRRDGRPVGVLFLDLDNFKHVNDTLGHNNGDILLIEAARRISACVRESSTVARLGGDEFLVILPGLDSEQAAERVASRILDAFAAPIRLERQEVFVTTSIGIALYPNDGTDTTTLLQQADAAMYQAKSRGKSDYQRFLPEMNFQSIERLRIESLLRRALEQEELQLVYQPIMDLATGQPVGAEALLRWNNSQLGAVVPDKFISLAEETGLILPIGDWVLYQATCDAARWRQLHNMDLSIAINVSPRQFRDKNFVERVRLVLEQQQLLPGQLELEITERLLLDSSIEVQDILQQLKDMFVKLAVDDFGTGYSALSYLKRFPFDSLKIDRSFTKDLMIQERDTALVQAIINMAHNLGLNVVAEGVETEAQLQFLRNQGCDRAQGYFLGYPMSASQFENWLLGFTSSQAS